MGMAPPIITPVIRHNDNNVILGNRNILFASIPDLLWQFFDRLLLNHRKMRETDTNCSNGKRKKGKVGRFWELLLQQSFISGFRAILCCHVQWLFPKAPLFTDYAICHSRSRRAPVLGMARKLSQRQGSGHPREEKNG